MAHINSSQQLSQFRAEAVEVDRGGKLHRLADVLRGDFVVNVTVALALAVGFFHGWLKLRFRSPATTFAFDILLIIALLLVYLRCGSLKNFIPPGPVGKALMALYALCALYLPFSLIPGMPPFLVALVAIRSWCFGTLMFCVGYHTIRSPVQMRAYYYLIIGLAVATAVYGARQSPEEIAMMMEADEYYAARFTGQGYVTSVGVEKRIFSTFVSSGAFGGTMAAAAVFAMALLTDRRTKMAYKVLLGAAIGIMGWGVLLSGARSAFAAAAVGLVAVPLLRRQYTAAALVVVVGGAGLLVKSFQTSGAALERFATLTDTGDVALRFLIPVYLGVDFVLQGHPLGGGLGKAGFVPMFLAGRTGYSDYVGADGDLGKLLIELGLPGLAIFGWLLWIASKTNWIYLRRHLQTPVGALALAGAVNFYISIITFPIGSPYISIPLGVMVWFVIGGTQKLVEQYEADQTAAPGGEAPPPPRVRLGMSGELPPRPENPRWRHPPAPAPAPPPLAVSPRSGKAPEKRFLFPTPAVDGPPATPVPPAPATGKRFLFPQSAAAEPPTAPAPPRPGKRFLFPQSGPK